MLRRWRRFSGWVVAQEIERPLWLNAKPRVQLACMCVFLPPGAAVGLIIGLATSRSPGISAFIGGWVALLLGNLYFYAAIVRARRRGARCRAASS